MGYVRDGAKNHLAQEREKIFRGVLLETDGGQNG